MTDPKRELYRTRVVWTLGSDEVQVHLGIRIAWGENKAFHEDEVLSFKPLDDLSALPEEVASMVQALRSPEQIQQACDAALKALTAARATLAAEQQEAQEASARKLADLDTQKAQLEQAMQTVQQAQAELEAEQLVLNQRAARITAERQELSELKTKVRLERPELAGVIDAFDAKNAASNPKDLAKDKL